MAPCTKPANLKAPKPKPLNGTTYMPHPPKTLPLKPEDLETLNPQTLTLKPSCDTLNPEKWKSRASLIWGALIIRIGFAGAHYTITRIRDPPPQKKKQYR